MKHPRAGVAFPPEITRERVAKGADSVLTMEDSTMLRLDDPAGLTRGEFERLSRTVMGGSPLCRI